MKLSLNFKLTVESLDKKGRGVAHDRGRRYLANHALPGEVLRVKSVKPGKRNYHVTDYELIKTHPARIEPVCPSFMDCGGCQLQHLSYMQQLELKQASLVTRLLASRVITTEQQNIFKPPITRQAVHYRRRCRLGVFQLEEGRVIIGFRRREHSQILDITSCCILESALDKLIEPLHSLVAHLSCSNRIPQLELVAAEETVALVIRHLLPLTEQDELEIRNFAVEQTVTVYTQYADPENLHLISSPDVEALSYLLPQFDVKLYFSATDFIQANANVNRQIVNEVVLALDIHADDKILDLFCGLGNFSLPVARYADTVVGMESKPALLQRARFNAEQNALGNVSFVQADLYQNPLQADIQFSSFNKLVLDPPREGAIVLLKQLPRQCFERIVYVSCDPETLARDLSYLVHQRGYMLESLCVADMFPHTMQLETVSVLVNKSGMVKNQ